MKKLLTYVQVLALPLLLACNEDKGNYDYLAINDVTISGIEESYTRLNGTEKLEINPVITTAFNDDSQLTYEWKVQLPNSPQLNYREVVGTDRNLSWDVQVPGTGEWVLVFRVTDTETGVVTMTTTNLNVTTRTGNGILLIGENTEGNSQVDFISIAGDTLVMKNVMNEGTGFSNKGKPVNVCRTGRLFSMMAMLAPTWVMTDEDAWRTNDDFSIVEGSNFKENTFVIDDSQITGDYHLVDFYPHQPRSITAMVMTSVAITSNGLLFVGSTGFVDPINVLKDEKGISFAKPYVLSSDLAPYFTDFVFYDETHERFLHGNVNQTYSNRLTDNEGDPFPWDNLAVGRTLQFAQNSTNKDGGSTYGNSYALMRDKNTGDYYVYKLYCMAYSTPVKIDCYNPGKVATDLDKATHHVFSSKRTALYYTVGSKLYGLDYNKGNEKVMLIKDFGDEITMMKVDDQIDPNSDFIYLATYNSTDGGTLMKLKQGTNPDKLELEEVPGSKWTGLSKVKGMTWK